MEVPPLSRQVRISSNLYCPFCDKLENEAAKKSTLSMATLSVEHLGYVFKIMIAFIIDKESKTYLFAACPEHIEMVLYASRFYMRERGSRARLVAMQ